MLSIVFIPEDIIVNTDVKFLTSWSLPFKEVTAKKKIIMKQNNDKFWLLL